MSCHEHARLLGAYFDSELDLTAALAVEDHLRSCSRCAGELARLRALRAALNKHAPIEGAPETLWARISAGLAPRRARGDADWRWGLAYASPGLVALALAMWLALAPRAGSESAASLRVVYHISSTASARDAMRNLANHLKASPAAKIVVVAHNDGVDFLLKGARDAADETYEPEVSRLLDRGVQFRVCANTLERRGIASSELIPSAALVPSGIAEIGRLQSAEGYAYLRL